MPVNINATLTASSFNTDDMHSVGFPVKSNITTGIGSFVHISSDISEVYCKHITEYRSDLYSTRDKIPPGVILHLSENRYLVFEVSSNTFKILQITNETVDIVSSTKIPSYGSATIARFHMCILTGAVGIYVVEANGDSVISINTFKIGNNTITFGTPVTISDYTKYYVSLSNVSYNFDDIGVYRVTNSVFVFTVKTYIMLGSVSGMLITLGSTFENTHMSTPFLTDIVVDDNTLVYVISQYKTNTDQYCTDVHPVYINTTTKNISFPTSGISIGDWYVRNYRLYNNYVLLINRSSADVTCIYVKYNRSSKQISSKRYYFILDRNIDNLINVDIEGKGITYTPQGFDNYMTYIFPIKKDSTEYLTAAPVVLSKNNNGFNMPISFDDLPSLLNLSFNDYRRIYIDDEKMVILNIFTDYVDIRYISYAITASEYTEVGNNNTTTSSSSKDTPSESSKRSLGVSVTQLTQGETGTVMVPCI